MSGSNEQSVSVWIAGLKAGDEEAAQRLWERYSVRLCDLARRHLKSLPRRMADEEDVVLIAFNSFCSGAREGRFARLNDRHDLWQLLLMITERKAIDLIKHEHRQKRGGGKVRGDSAFLALEDDPAVRGIQQVVGNEPTPEFAALTAEECQRLLDSLHDKPLCQVVIWKMEGYTNTEIAEKLGCVVRSIERKLSGIRMIWSGELAP
jgi:DNA-directed RNA polymerase specialized sigma24 family protein